MTVASKRAEFLPDEVRPSLLPFNPADLVRIRVLPAELARAFDVSKQTVSQWEKKGWIARGPDGRIDPYVAARSVFAKADPARMRARIFREAMQTQQELRERIAQLESERARVEDAAVFRFLHGQQHKIAAFCDALADDFDALSRAHDAGQLRHVIERLCGRWVYGLSDAVMDEWDESPAAEGPPVSPAKVAP